MARPREFDIDLALERAMQVFWAKGYDGASLQDLLDAMGIARGSLYKAFKDKHSIYLAALDRYDRTVVSQGIAVLSAREVADGVARIRNLLMTASEPVALRNDRRGCLLCNAAIDQASIDPEVQTRVMAMLKRLERAFEAALADGKATGDWPPRRRAEMARLLTSAYMGLRVLARAGYPAAEIETVVGASLQPLRPN